MWQNGVGTVFASPTGLNIDAVIAINASGHVIGTYYTDTDTNKRAFFWDGTTCTDLGDFADSDNPYLWPGAINDSDQVVGTSYYTGIAPVTPTAFLWQQGVLSPLDGMDDFGNTSGIGLSNAGKVVGQYWIPGKVRLSTGSSGGFYWFGDTATDLSSLGGGGTLPFGVSAAGAVYGTSYSGASADDGRG